MNPIGTVNELVDALHNSAPDDYRTIAKFIDIPAADFMAFAHWADEGYTRNCIELTEDFELILLCWNPGDVTPVHCHGQQRCWVRQVSGKLEEVIYQKNRSGKLGELRRHELQSGGLSYMDDAMGYHSLQNNSDAMAMSLHLYAKPIESCTYYNDELDRFIPKDLEYHSFKGELLNTGKPFNREKVLGRLTRSAMI